MKKTIKIPLVVIIILTIPLLAASCETETNYDLQRPADKTNMNATQPNKDNKGAVAGDTASLPRRDIVIGNQTLVVEIADNDAARAQGLSGRKILQNGTGMLFDFTNTSYRKPGFWMKDMFISIDMIWIDQNKIIGITPNVPVPSDTTNLPSYHPPSEITHVLEVPAGWSAKNNITAGDSVSL